MFKWKAETLGQLTPVKTGQCTYHAGTNAHSPGVLQRMASFCHYESKSIDGHCVNIRHSVGSFL